MFISFYKAWRTVYLNYSGSIGGLSAPSNESYHSQRCAACLTCALCRRLGDRTDRAVPVIRIDGSRKPETGEKFPPVDTDESAAWFTAQRGCHRHELGSFVSEGGALL